MSEKWLDTTDELEIIARDIGDFLRRQTRALINFIGDRLAGRRWFRAGDGFFALLIVIFSLIGATVYLETDKPVLWSLALIFDFFHSLFAMVTSTGTILAIFTIIGMALWLPIKKKGLFAGCLLDLTIITAVAILAYLWWKTSLAAAVATAIFDFIAIAALVCAKMFTVRGKKSSAVVKFILCLNVAAALFIFPYSTLQWQQPPGPAIALALLSFGGGMLSLYLTTVLFGSFPVYLWMESFYRKFGIFWSIPFSTAMIFVCFFILDGAIIRLILLYSPLQAVFTACWQGIF
jgi:hypothetical protein